MASKAVRIDLGDMTESVERHLRDGEYTSVDEVLREGVRALDREKTAFDDACRRRIQAALDDPRPSVPDNEAFAELDRRAAARRRA